MSLRTPENLPCAVMADLRRYDAEMDREYTLEDAAERLAEERFSDHSDISEVLEGIDLNDHAGEIAAWLVQRRGGKVNFPESEWPEQLDDVIRAKQLQACREEAIEADERAREAAESYREDAFIEQRRGL